MKNNRMTVGQLAHTVREGQGIYLKSMIDVHDEALLELTMYIRALPGVMTMDVYSLEYVEGKGFVAQVGMPTDILKALGKTK